MIRVEVQDYCQSCLEFEPDVERPTQFYADSKVVKQTDTVIRCEHRTRCENIKHYHAEIIKEYLLETLKGG